MLGLRAHTLYWEDKTYTASYLTNLFQQIKKDEEKENREQIAQENARTSIDLTVSASALIDETALAKTN